jgi:hypothetical protein
MSAAEDAGIKAGSRVVPGAQTASTACNDLISVDPFTVAIVGGQLQANAQVTPKNGSDTVLTLMVAATNGTGTTYAGANAVVSGNGSSEGQAVTALAFSDIYNVQQYGTSILGVIQGMLLTSSGTCFYSITRHFDLG